MERPPKRPPKGGRALPQTTAEKSDNRSVSLTVSSWQGVIPPPEQIAKFEEIVPGSGHIIFEMAQEQARHRMDLEKRVVYANTRHQLTAMVGGITILLAVVILGMVLALTHQSITGVFTAFGGVLVGGTTFAWGYRKQREQLEANKRSQIEARTPRRIAKP